jgi:hypothetical protein
VAGQDHARTIPFGCDHSAATRLVLRWPPPSTRRAPTSMRLGAFSYRTGPRPTSRNGADRKPGRLRNIGRFDRHERMPPGQHWLIVVGSGAFEDPIPLPPACHARGCSPIYQKLPKAEQQIEDWHTAVETLILVAESNGGPDYDGSHRRHAGAKPSRRARVQSRSQGPSLGKAKA